jgi:hypothetical protein
MADISVMYTLYQVHCCHSFMSTAKTRGEARIHQDLHNLRTQQCGGSRMLRDDRQGGEESGLTLSVGTEQNGRCHTTLPREPGKWKYETSQEK